MPHRQLPKHQRDQLVQDNLLWLEGLFLGLLPDCFHQDCTLSQATILVSALLARFRGRQHTVTSLAEELGKSRSTVQRTIDFWVERGSLRLEPDPDDGRRRRIETTQQGRDRVWRNLERVSQFRMAHFQRLHDLLTTWDLVPEGSNESVRAFLADLTVAIREAAQRHLGQ